MRSQVQSKIYFIARFIETSGLLQFLILLLLILTVTVAIIGLVNIVKQGKKGPMENLAFDLLQNLVRYKDYYRTLRSPAIHITEYPRKYQASNSAALKPKEELQALKFVFMNRWLKFSQEWDKLYDLILLSEVFWKEWARKEKNECQNLMNSLKYNIEQMLLTKIASMTSPSSQEAKKYLEFSNAVYLQEEQDKEYKRFTRQVSSMINTIKKQL